MQCTRIVEHIALVAYATTWRLATSVLTARPADGSALVEQLGILVAGPALAAVGLDAFAVYAAGRADGIAYGSRAVAQTIALIAAATSAVTATIDALLGAMRFT